VRVLEGKVTVNGKAARTAIPIGPGDVIVTGQGAKLVFVLGEDAFLLRGNSRLSLDKPGGGNNTVVGGLRILTGALLAVFGKGQRRVVTSTATIRIRGTGVYLEVARDQTYLCVCYGDVEVRNKNGAQLRHLISGYHTAAMIYADMRAGQTMAGAEVKKHTDEELIMLESLVGRTSPVKLRNQKLDEGAAARREGVGATRGPQPLASPATPVAEPVGAAQPAAADTAVQAHQPVGPPPMPIEQEWRLPPPATAVIVERRACRLRSRPTLHRASDARCHPSAPGPSRPLPGAPSSGSRCRSGSRVAARAACA
jgi:hypothetical protein